MQRLDADRIRIKDKAGLLATITIIAGLPAFVGGFALLVLLYQGFVNPAAVALKQAVEW